MGLFFLIILVAAMVVTLVYQWNTNKSIEFSIRNDGDPSFTETSRPIEEVIPAEENKIVADDAMKMDLPEPVRENNQEDELETANN